MNNTGNDSKKIKKNTDWIRNFAIGLLLFISGILSKFFPATIMTVTYVVSGVVFALIGISDGVSALKYKETGSDWKLTLIMGGISLLAAVYFIPAVIYLYSVNISIYVLCAWLISRGSLNIAGLARGTLKRKNVLLWAVVMIAMGTFAGFFCEQIVSYSSTYLPYILIVTGVLLSFFGIYQKTDEKEAKEKKLREEAIQNGLANAVDTMHQNNELIEAPKEDPEVSLTDAENKGQAEENNNDSPAQDVPAEAACEAEETIEVTQDTLSTEEKKEDEITEVEVQDATEIEAQIVENPKGVQTKKKGLFDSLFKK